MSGSYEAVRAARLHFNAQGVPCSTEYGDVYHSASGALEQARHVFLRGNRLPERWRDRAAFTVCETGFGLGQNFLAAWQAWRDDPRRSRRLHYLAFEAHPFEAADLRRALSSRLPSALATLAAVLADRWPLLTPGLHRLEFEGGAVTLTLAFGSVRRMAPQAQARVDAFFLDGFAPGVNPEMWTPALFGQLRRLAVAGATAATWCSAGQVRRDLRDAGFLVEKAPGFGGKRDMTVAVLRPGLGTPAAAPRARRLAVVGGGIAGAGIAQSLALRGHEVCVYDPVFARRPEEALRVRGAAALVPALTPDDDTRSRLSRSGLACARRRWLSLPGLARPEVCGALVCARTRDEAAAQCAALDALAFPPEWVRWMDAAEAGARAGATLHEGGLWFEQALLLRPGALLPALLGMPGVQTRAACVNALRAAGGGAWRLLGPEGGVLQEADGVVLANAAEASALLATGHAAARLPKLAAVQRLAGQISVYRVPAGTPGADVPRCILSGKGYCLPPRMGWGVAGSTYRPDAAESVVDAAGHREIRAQLAAWLPEGAVPWLDRGSPEGWAGWRAATADHLPIIGGVPDAPGLWLACAYGSRGLSWSALAGDILGAELDAEPAPIERELAYRIRPR
ncbi:tRNA (5-methylaminomethyl-2-thiouridine)(34)-methyltransferase MnmD [Castellaniella sp. GW247-6E4]|uniref:tRNA (5-methylaminomethyl-2-thiouridine)(34)-methyltransferase MnmD n=1 Tax=Castellaniella sp. GW247-6E4 TaxID=3140380 RepID=UPI00331545E7